MYTNRLSRMLCNNQRTCSTVGKRERQLEGYGHKWNLNSVLNMDRQPSHLTFPAIQTGATLLKAFFFMSHRSHEGMALCLLYKDVTYKVRYRWEGEKNTRRCCLSTTKVQWWLNCKLECYEKMKKKCQHMPWSRHFLQCTNIFVVFLTTFFKPFQSSVKLAVLMITPSKQVKM